MIIKYFLLNLVNNDREQRWKHITRPLKDEKRALLAAKCTQKYTFGVVHTVKCFKEYIIHWDLCTVFSRFNMILFESFYIDWC